MGKKVEAEMVRVYVQATNALNALRKAKGQGQQGQGMVEYAIMLVLVVAVFVVGFAVFAPVIDQWVTEMSGGFLGL